MVQRVSATAILLVLALGAAPAAALDPGRAVTQYRRDVWKTPEGLPQNSVEAIAQTPDGYLWLGTQEGLARFDGLRFVVFDKTSTKELRHNRVTALLADRRGTLWIGTEGGGVTRLRDDVFTAYGIAEGLPSLRIRDLAQDRNGSIWAGTDRGLARLQNERFVPGPPEEGVDRRAVLALFSGSGGLWVGFVDGLVRLRDGAVEPGAVRGLPASPVNALWEDADGTLFIGTARGLFVRRAGQTDVVLAPAPAGGQPVTAIRRDRGGSLWLGTEVGAKRIAKGAASDLGVREGLSHLVVQIFEDHEGSLWIGTQDGGLIRLADGKFTTYSRAEGLPADVIWPVFGDREGSIWIGTKTDGIARLRDGRIDTFTTRDGLSSNAVQSLAQTADGSLFIGTRGGGLDRLKDGRFTVYGARDGLPNDSVSALLAARDGGLWIGTRGGGLSRFSNGAFTTWNAKDGLPNSTIHGLLETRDGALYIATNGGGLVRFANGVFRAFTAKDGLASETVNTLYEDALGTLWVGTYGGGLHRMRDDRLTAYTTAEGLTDDAIFSILEDDQGRLWMSCNKGVFRVDKRQLDELDRKSISLLTPVSYGVEDGMKNRECNGANQPSAWRDGRGRLWFPTIEGVAMVDPAHLPSNPVPPPVTIERLVVDGRRMSRRDGLVLEPGTRNLEFHYTAPSFVVPARVRFRYMLEGLDTEWVEAGSRRVAYYSHVPSRSFRFRVTAANDDGLWNEKGASLSFRLRPRYYETPWFYAACALVLAGAFWAGDRLRTRRVKAREEALRRLVDERTRELADANLRLERLSALDGLTGVANRRRFDEALDAEWRRGCRSGAPLSLVLLDVDFFKSFNDTRGHLAGDECLRQVAQVVARGLTRAGDLVARYGGEEFVALLPGMGAPDALALAERLRAAVFAHGLPHEASATSSVVTVSAGVATTIPSDESAPEALVAAADEALYRAKGEGRNRVAAA